MVSSVKWRVRWEPEGDMVVLVMEKGGGIKGPEERGGGDEGGERGGVEMLRRGLVGEGAGGGGDGGVLAVRWMGSSLKSPVQGGRRRRWGFGRRAEAKAYC